MKYLVYLRVSTDEQETEMQMELCKEYARKNNPAGDYTIEFFNDQSMSSGVEYKKRTELQKMLSSIKKGDTVLVYKLDRLSRDIIEMVTIYRLIVRTLEAKVVSLNDPYSDEFTVGLMGLLAQKERDTTRIRVKDGLGNKKNKGQRYSGKLPYGYGMHETKLVPIRKGKEIVMKRGVLVPIAEEQKVIALMEKLAAEGRSYQDIATTLTLWGHKSREETPFHKMTVWRILQRIKEEKLKGRPPTGREVELIH